MNRAYKYKMMFDKVLFLFIVCSIFLFSCTSKNPYNIVTFNGEGTVFNNSKSFIWVNSKADSLNPVSFLVEKGDLMILENNILLYRNTGEKEYTFKTDKSFGYINGKVNSLNISKGNDLIPWFKQMKDADILDLQVILIIDTLPDTYIPYLKQISKIKPNIGISTDISMVPELLQIFSPSFLISQNSTQLDIEVLKNCKNLELLYLTIDNASFSTALPAMPKLKQIIISGIEENKTIGNDFFKNNPQIERLICMGKDSIDLSFIKPLNNLKQFGISGFNKISGFSSIENFKNLEVLSLIGDNFLDFNLLNNLKSLRWLALPVNTTQEQFATIVESHPDLEVLELVKNEEITDLSPLKKLKKLYGLTITDTLTDYNALSSLKQLKYLSIPAKISGNSNKIEELKKSLPGCKVVTNEGFCLGSGWLLVVFPFILLFALFFRRKKV